MPADPKLQAAVGRVAVRHGQMDHFLRMTIKSVSGLTIEQTMKQTKRLTSGPLCDRLSKYAGQRLGTHHPAVQKLEEILDEARSAADSRNKLMHGLWAIGEDGEQKFYASGTRRAAVPTITDLNRLESRLDTIASNLNQARRHGFLRKALDPKKSQLIPVRAEGHPLATCRSGAL